MCRTGLSPFRLQCEGTTISVRRPVSRQCSDRRRAKCLVTNETSSSHALDIRYEDNHCLALNKPAGWPSTHFDGTEETVDRLAKAYLKEKHQKPGNVFLGVVHRLDKPVSGVLLFARTSKAAARLSEQFRDGSVQKTYWAITSRDVATEGRFAELSSSGVLEDWLLRDDKAAMTRVVPPGTPGAQAARLLFQVRSVGGGFSWLELRPHTGRKHQLRAQLAWRGASVYGDKKYGSRYNFGPAIALHARSLTFQHPTKQESITVTAEVPKYWGKFAALMRDDTT